MKRYYLLGSFLLFSVLLLAQNKEVPFSTGIGLGVDIISNKDNAASPLSYSGFGLPIGINGLKVNKKWLHHFEALFVIPAITNNYPLTSVVNTQLNSWTKVNISYQALRCIGSDSLSYLGVQLKSDFFYREYDFLDGMSWELVNGLNINFARKISISDNSFFLTQINIPIIAYINRKSSLTFDEIFLDDFYNKGPLSLFKYGTWQFNFDKWIAVEFNLLYHKKLSNRLNLLSKIGVNYYAIHFPEKVYNLNIPISCYLNYQF